MHAAVAGVVAMAVVPPRNPVLVKAAVSSPLTVEEEAISKMMIVANGHAYRFHSQVDTALQAHCDSLIGRTDEVFAQASKTGRCAEAGAHLQAQPNFFFAAVD